MPALKIRKGKSSADEVHRTEDLIKMVEYAGWESRVSGGQMYVIYPPDCESITVNCGSAAGDWRNLENAKARLRRAGLFTAVDTKYIEETGAAKARAADERAKADLLIETLNDTHAAQAAPEGDPVGKRALQQLVDRCVAVGWSVKPIGADKTHYLINTPRKNRPFTIQTSNTVRTYPADVLTQLTRLGLLEAEAALPAADKASNIAAATPAADTTDNTAAPEAESGVGAVPGGISLVDGVEVAEWAWSKTPTGAQDRKTTELLLDDGSLVYACIKGDFIGKTWQSTVQHRKKAHPELLSATAKARNARKAADKLAAAPQLSIDDTDELDGISDDALPAGVRPVISLNRPAAPAPLFPPAANAHAPSQSARLEQLLGVAPLPAAVTALLPDPPPSRPAALTAVPAGPLPHTAEPAVTTAPTVVRPNVAAVPAPVSADRAVEEPVQPRRHETTPVARVQISEVAATVRTPQRPTPASISSTTANGTAGAGGASATGAPLLDMVEMVARLQKLQQGGAVAEELREQNAALATQVAELTGKLEQATKQGQALAEQCITKDSTIRRLRKELADNAETVAAAQQLQQLMSNLMGSTAQAA